MVAQVSKPGVNIRQVFEGTPPAPVTPQLVPCIVGPLFEVVDVLDDAGVPTSDSKVATSSGDLRYAQLPIELSTADLPTPHADPTQMSLIDDSVSVLLAQSGSNLTLSRTSAFLAEMNLGHKPGLFIEIDPAVVPQTVVNLALDVALKNSVLSDFHISIAANDTAAQIAAKINSAVGVNVASAVSDFGDEGLSGVLIQSQRAGAAASVTLRKSSGGFTSSLISESVRVEGAGLHAEDNPISNMSSSAYVVHSRGKTYSGATLSATVLPAGVYSQQTGLFGDVIVGQVSEIDFTEFSVRAATPTSDGDLLTATGPYGQSISRVMITAVQPTRLRLGVVDTTRSTYDASGAPLSQKYIDFALNELGTSSPFAPRNGFITAQSLSGANPLSEAATLTSTVSDIEGFVLGTAASLTADMPDFAGVVGMTGTVTLLVDDIETAASYTFTDSDTAETIVADLSAAFSSIGVAVAEVDGQLVISSMATGANINLALSGAVWGDAAGENNSGTDPVVVDITGQMMTVSFDNSALKYQVLALTDSLRDLVTIVNDAIGASVLVYAEEDDVATLTLTSPLRGVASDVSVTGELADALFPLAHFAPGSGRPDPELVVTAGVVSVAPQCLRSSMTGRPLNTSAVTHVGYRALRTDTSALANQPGILRVSNTSDLESIYGPVDVRNPLALGIFFALINAGDGVEVNAISVDDVSESEPNGTLASYARAFEFLRAYEVYAITPLTNSEEVIQIADAHVKDMSEPNLRGERVLISAPNNPTRRNDYVVLSTGATGAESTSTEYQVDLNASPESVLASLGIDTSGEIPFQLDDGRQLQLTLKIGDAQYRMSVISVDGARVTLRSSLTTAQNADGHYTTDALPAAFSGAQFSLSLRGTELTLAGSTRLDRTAFAETVRDKAQQYLNRRHVRLYPDTVQSAAVGGLNQRLPSFYWGAALSGACANLPAQEPFTRVPLVGFNDVIGPGLDRVHYDVISAGNSVIEVESPGLSPALRIQTTTDPSTIESREWSVTRAVDLFAKSMRAQLRSRIGRFNITQAYLDELTLIVDSLCSAATTTGLFRSTTIDKVEQSPTQPDTILVVIRVEVLYPANYIDITIVV